VAADGPKVDEPGTSRGARRFIPGLLLLLAWSLYELRPFLESGLPLFFDAHSHLTRSWLAARALSAGSYPTWSFEWYGGYRLLEFYSPGYYLLTAGIGILGGDVARATKLVLYAGQIFSVAAFYLFLIRLRAAPLAALFGALLYLYDAQRWLTLAVIGNHPTVLLYAVAPLLLLAAQGLDETRRSCLRLFSAGALLVSAMTLGHLLNAVSILPGLLAFAVAWPWQSLSRRAARRAVVGLAAALLASSAVTAFLTIPMLRNLHLVSLSLDTAGIAWDFEPVAIALGFQPGSAQRRFVVTPGAFWCALAIGAGTLSLYARHSRWRACFAGLCASLLSLALLGERAVIALIFFVSPLCVAALEIVSRAARDRAGRSAAVALQILAVASVPLWQLTRDRTPLRYIDRETLEVYQRIPGAGELGRTFDVTPAADWVDGVYGWSSFSPFWTGRAVPFGGFPQGAPLASNLQLALVGKLVSELGAPHPVLSPDALDLLRLLHVEWLVDRSDSPRLARLSLDPGTAERAEPGLIRLQHASPALFAGRLAHPSDVPRSSIESGAPSLLPQLLARWAKEPLDVSGLPSLDALYRVGVRRDWTFLLPLLRGMQIDRTQARADRFFVERTLVAAEPAGAGAAEFRVLAHHAQLEMVTIAASATLPGFVRLAYSFDPDLRIEIDGEPAPSTADFLGGIVLAFPAGSHEITLKAPLPTQRLGLLAFGGGIAMALATLWAWTRRPRASPAIRVQPS
jgi:hypothetical protein